MADALLFYRTTGTRKWNNAPTNTIPAPDFDPEDLPDAQKLTFTLPDDLLESVSLIYENNIKDAPVSNPAGVRKINKQDNGLQQLVLTFRGRFRDASTDIQKMQDFAERLQVEGVFHQFGQFGFKASNTVSTPFNFDPIDSFGFTIKRLSISRVGGKPKNFDFELTMTSGGTKA